MLKKLQRFPAGLAVRMLDAKEEAMVIPTREDAVMEIPSMS